MLQLGHNPIITSIFSLRFVNVFIFLVTKFILFAYLNSLAIQSFMLGTVAISQEPKDSVYVDLYDTYYRGLCSTPVDDSKFCADKPVVSMFTATRTFPVLLLSSLYFGPLLFLINRVIKRPNPFSFETLIHFVFPLVTNISLFGIVPKYPMEEHLKAKRVKRSNSLPDLKLESLYIKHHGSEAGYQTGPGQISDQRHQTTQRPKTTGLTMEKRMVKVIGTPARAHSVSVCWEETALQSSSEEMANMARDSDRVRPTTSILSLTPIRRQKKNIAKSVKVKTGLRRRTSLPAALEDKSKTADKHMRQEFSFSWKQSTVLYCFFLFNILTSGLSDVLVQLANKKALGDCKRPNHCDTSNGTEDMSVLESLLELDAINQAYLVLLIINILSWITFLLGLRRGRAGKDCMGQSSCLFLKEVMQNW